MTIDFHTHGKLAKNLPFSESYTVSLFRDAAAAGLDAICLTEHFNTLALDTLYRYIADSYDREGDCFLAEGVRVFPGLEVDVRETGHVLIVGGPEAIAAISDVLAPCHDKDAFPPLAELFAIARAHDVLIGLAHPFREGGNLPALDDALLRGFDFIDLNGKDYASEHEATALSINGLAHRLALPVLAGSDTHQSFQYGCIYNVFEEDCCTIGALRAQIAAERFCIEIREDIDFRVKSAGILKKSLKALYATGGDYVAPLLG